MAKGVFRPQIRARAPKVVAYALGLQKKQTFRFLVVWLAAYLILLSMFFGAILKDDVYLEIFPKELILPFLMHATTALLIVLFVYWLPWLRDFLAKLASAIVATLLMVDYDTNLQGVAGVVRALTPGLGGGDHMAWVSLVYLVILLGISVLAGAGVSRLVRRSRRVSSRDLSLGLLIIVGFLSVPPAFSVMRILPAIVQQSRVQSAELTEANPQPAATDKPDIYYIVLDRYANAEVLKQQFDFDNSPFTDSLKAAGFYVNNQAYSNYPYTTMSVSSTMNAGYINGLVAPFKDSPIQSRTLYHNLIRQSSVIKALQKEGYTYHALGSWYGASNKAPLANNDYTWQHELTVLGKHKRLRGVEASEFTKSPYYQFARLSSVTWWPIQIAHREHIDEVRDQLNTLDTLAAAETPGSRFIFAHILVPHDPFVFNSDGSLAAHPGVDSIGKPIKQKYLDQVQFINAKMTEFITKIQKQSKGEAVIVFSADEGPYPQVLNNTFEQSALASASMENDAFSAEDMTTWSTEWLKAKFGILQAAHIPKATDNDLAHMSSVNVFRIILNRYAGYELEYLPQCHFGLPTSRRQDFNHVDITHMFVGKSALGGVGCDFSTDSLQ